jgi:hypothetical protein
VKGRFESYDTCTGFYGRVRNDLPRAVKIRVKASFNNAQGELIEVRTFWLQLFSLPEESLPWNIPGVPEPSATVRFKNDVEVDHLPEGWKYQLEVIEAEYVK